MAEHSLTSTGQKRIAWIDLAKGLAIFCIVYGHASRNTGILSRAVYTFHVPLCVFLSGWLYHYKGESLGEHLKKSAQRLLIPYFVWSLISILIYMVMGQLAADSLDAEFYSLRENLMFLFTGRSIANAALWYLPFLFLTYLTAYGICRGLSRKKPESGWGKAAAIGIPLLLSLAALCFYTEYQYSCSLDLPFGINNTVFLFPFFWLGFAMQQGPGLPQKKCWIPAALALLGSSIFCGLAFNDEVEYMRLTDSDYGTNIPVFYLTALGSSVALCWLCRLTGKCSLLQWFGRHSMSILLMHKFPVLFFQVILGNVGAGFGKLQFLWYLLISLASMALCCAAGEIFLRIAPWAIGERKKK